MKKIIIVAPVSKSLINFRGDLIKDMKNNGHNVITASPALSEEYVNIFQQQKIDNIPINFQRNRLNPFYDLLTLIKLFKTKYTHVGNVLKHPQQISSVCMEDIFRR